MLGWISSTFGCLVTDGTRRFILSNNHVLASENALPLNSPIFQPGLLDGGVAPADRIARLRTFVRIRKLPANNRVDAAIAALDAPGPASPRILPNVGALGSTASLPAAVGMRVHKHGRTTGYTRGRVVDVSADVNITYDFGVARFLDQIVIVGDAYHRQPHRRRARRARRHAGRVTSGAPDAMMELPGEHRSRLPGHGELARPG